MNIHNQLAASAARGVPAPTTPMQTTPARAGYAFAARRRLMNGLPALEAACAARTLTDITACIGRRGWRLSPPSGLHTLPHPLRTQALYALVSRLESGLDADSNADIQKCNDVDTLRTTVNGLLGRTPNCKSAASGIYTLPPPWPMRLLIALQRRIPAMAQAYANNIPHAPLRAEAMEFTKQQLHALLKEKILALHESARCRINARISQCDRTNARGSVFAAPVDRRSQRIMDKQIARACLAPNADWYRIRRISGSLDSRRRHALLTALFNHHLRNDGPPPSFDRLHTIFDVTEREYHDTWTVIDAEKALCQAPFNRL